jgi:hypothetical protein
MWTDVLLILFVLLGVWLWRLSGLSMSSIWDILEYIRNDRKRKRKKRRAYRVSITSTWGIHHMDFNVKPGKAFGAKAVGRDFEGDITGNFTNGLWTIGGSNIVTPSADGKACTVQAGQELGEFTLTFTADSTDTNGNAIKISASSTVTVAELPAQTVDIVAN